MAMRTARMQTAATRCGGELVAMGGRALMRNARACGPSGRPRAGGGSGVAVLCEVQCASCGDGASELKRIPRGRPRPIPAPPM
eukprot:366278-Chlamydomonas_euryale.AAC.3